MGRHRSRIVLAVALASVLVAVSGCDGDDDAPRARRANDRAATTAEPSGVPGARDQVVLRGRATLDGASFDADFMGAVVVRDGFATPCQQALPPVDNGRYEITVLAATEGSGCGAPGAHVLLWTYTRDAKFFSSTSAPWPVGGRETTFDPRFSAAAPNGAAPAMTELSGEVFDRDGRRLPPGPRVEAYIGETRCAVASVRGAGEFVGFVIAIVGPGSIAGCGRGATVTFRVDGRPATETAVNRLTPGPPGSGGTFDLTLS